MANSVARINDIGVGQCNHPSHNGTINMTGHIITSAQNIYGSGNKQVARYGDIVMGDCGHTGTINTCSSKVIQEPTNKGLARVGDSFNGYFSGNIVSGDTKVIIG